MSVNQRNVLFICVHNSARSQMAEEYLRLLAGDGWQVESAGFEPTEVNPLVVEALLEDGVDIRGKQTQSVFELFKRGRMYHYVITVCAESEGGECPIFPGMTHRLHLPFEDPASLEGTHEEKLGRVREIRDSIKQMVRQFVEWDTTRKPGVLGNVWGFEDIDGTAA